MKKVSKIIALALAIMMLSGVAVLAADIATVTGPTAPVSAADKITITATAPATVEQITVLVYKSTADVNALTDSDIAYIDQKAYDATIGGATFEFYMRDGFLDGKYAIKVGGTTVGTAKAGTDIDYAAVANVKFTLNGTVTAKGDQTVAPTITIKNASDEVVATPTVAEGAFTASLDAGTYTITISKNYHVTRDITGVTGTSGATVDAGATDLIAGDLNNDGGIDEFDLNQLGNSWYAATGDENFDIASDINNDGGVDEFDLNELGNSWYKSADSYNQ